MEGLGAAASVIAVASIAIQIGDSALKLKRFVDDIKDAPEEVKLLIGETKTFGLFLSEMASANSTKDLPIAPSPLATQCLDSCRQAATILEKAVTELQVEMKNRKNRGGFKAALKKGPIDKLKERLSRAQTMLLVSQTFHSRLLQEHQHHLQQQWFASIQAQICQNTVAVQSLRLLPARSASEEHQVALESHNTQNGSRVLEKQFNRARQDRQREHRFTIRLQGPRWFYLTSRALEISGYKSPTGWDFSTKMKIVVSHDSLVFRLAEAGDLCGLQRLFEQGKASPFAEDERENTLLFAASSRVKPDVVKFLIQQGVRDSAMDSGTNYFGFIFYTFLLHENTEILGLLTPSVDWSTSSNATRARHLWTCIPKTYTRLETWSLLHNQYDVSLQQLTSLELLKCITPGLGIILPQFKFLLAGRQIDSTLCGTEISKAWPRWEGFNFFQAFAVAFSVSWGWYLHGTRAPMKHYMDHESYKEYLEILQRLVRGGSDIHKVYDSWDYCPDCGHSHYTDMTPFIRILTGRGFRWPIPTTRNIVWHWLCALREAGVDLYEYGRREKEILASSQKSIGMWDHWNYSGKNRLITFDFGSEPGNWKLYFTEETIFTQLLEFWDMVDHPERAIPGAWLDERFETNKKRSPSCSEFWDNFWWP